MAKVTYIQTNMTGGELSPRLDGRVDIQKYKNGCRVIENMQVLPHGGARKRSGFQYVVAQKSDTDDVIMVPFQYNVEQSYMLMFGPSYVWFFKDRGIITQSPVGITGITQANPGVVTTSTAHGLTTGDRVVLFGISGMTELNNRQIVVTVLTTTTFEIGINATTFDAYTSGGEAAQIVELATTYTADELPELSFAQTNDVLYIAHRNHPLRKLSRQSHTLWTLSEPSINTGPFRSVNADRDLRITPSSFSASATGYGTHIVGTSCTLTATAPVFASGMVGALFKLSEDGGGTGISSANIGNSSDSVTVNDVYTESGNVYGISAVTSGTFWNSFRRVPQHESGTVRMYNGARTRYADVDFLHPGYCVVRITAYTSSTVVTAQIVRYQMAQSIVDRGTTFWNEGAWSDHRGYPRAIAFYEQRLFLAGSQSDPTVLWSSRSASFEDFEDGDDDDDAIVYRVNAGSADVVRWLSSGRVLTAGSSMGEFAISASNQNEALTPDNFKAAPQTTYGTSQCPPVRFGQAVLYPQRNGNPANAALKVREFSYQFERDSFDSVDLTVFAEHVTGPGFNRMAFQVQPEPYIWIRRTDGQLASCTYERAQEVVAWHRQVLGGSNAQAITLGVIPGNEQDDLWLSVERLLGDPVIMVAQASTDGNEIVTITEDGFITITEDAETVRYVEVSQPPFRDSDDKADARMLDAMLTYNGVQTTTLNGLHHLRGLEVKVLNNGSVETHTVDADGRVTLDYPTTYAHVGLPYTAILETEDFEGGAQAGTAQSRVKRISQIFLRVLNSLGAFRYGPDANTANMSTAYFRTGADVHGTSPPLYSGLKELDFKGGYERVARVRIEHDEPLPLHVTGIVAEMNVAG
jgi:hypothetical protein